jgi:adenylylsulfate reductase subunit B
VFFGSEKKKTPLVSYPQECWHCNACVLACPAEGAIRLRIPLPMMVCYK